MIEFGTPHTDRRPISLSEAAALFPDEHGRPIKEATLRQWCTRGARGKRLEAAIIGGRIYTSLEAMRRFAAARSEADST